MVTPSWELVGRGLATCLMSPLSLIRGSAGKEPRLLVPWLRFHLCLHGLWVAVAGITRRTGRVTRWAQCKAKVWGHLFKCDSELQHGDQARGAS